MVFFQKNWTFYQHYAKRQHNTFIIKTIYYGKKFIKYQRKL